MKFINKLQKDDTLPGNSTEFSHLSKKSVINKGSSLIWSLVRFVMLVGLSYIILYPIIFCLSLSIRQPSDMMDPTVIWLPKNLTFDNIKFVLEKTGFTEAFGKSLAISLLCSVLQMLSCAITGYGFARFKFPFKNVLFFISHCIR